MTDIVDARTYKPSRSASPPDAPRVAVVGSGPAGLTAAHYLSLDGFKVTVFEADSRPGGMLVSGIPSYRLKRDVLEKEIESLVDANITVCCDTALGRDFTIDALFQANSVFYVRRQKMAQPLLLRGAKPHKHKRVYSGIEGRASP